MTISTSSSLLINEAPLQVLPSLAVALKNINEAIMLQQIQYWLQKSKNEYKGRKWIYNTINEWHEQFPWLTDRSIKARFDSLRKKGIIITANLNKNSFDHTNWYSIDYDALDKLLDDENQEKKPKNLDITDSEESSPSKKKNLHHRKGNKFRMDDEESSPSDSEESSPSDGEESSPSIPEITRDYSETTQRVPSVSHSSNSKLSKKIDRIEIEFEKLWKLYPKKIGKKDALNSYMNWRAESSKNTYERAVKQLSDYLKYLKNNKITNRYIFNGSNWFGGHIDDDVDLSKPKNFGNKKHVRELPDWDKVAKEHEKKKTENRMSSEEYDRIFKEFSAAENKNQKSDTVSSKPDAGHGNNSFEMSDDVRQVYHDLGLDEFLD
ncbi:hypothetical protein [Lactobacillus taiwanensis]|uniref:Replication protein n=1 Tax=Lactobacillus taiwanensis TaxID=508451 RepID=A0A256LIL2_9LACO|nr:hypothetical protein [Lactobacillus taiwanensis]OYR89059.1 hypothetical protein CBF53_00815 [Lactobacillus taiwanensis]OYR90237.1 hypothetical protein CBF59_09265 [Lactobacillus taiwanensis]OYR93190.1 hypothetical protein CBF70_00945 [Lactobacillus taiwanensis]OYR94575.1 hypothetical protein CBF51_10390 [Lactobacillus taiwanensis]OYR97233.1 hypothetical protein CBF58_00645 [Lactobacillus taiwanensis]